MGIQLEIVTIVRCASAWGEVSVCLVLLLLHPIVRWSDCKTTGFSSAFGGAQVYLPTGLVLWTSVRISLEENHSECFLNVEELQPVFNINPKLPVHKKCILVWFSCAGLSCESLFELLSLVMHITIISLHQWRLTLWWAASLKHKQLNSMCNCRTKILAVSLPIGFSLSPFSVWILRSDWEPMKRIWSMGWGISACLQWSVLSAFWLDGLLRVSLLCLPLCPISIHCSDIEAHELGFTTYVAAWVLWGKNTNLSCWWRIVVGEVYRNVCNEVWMHEQRPSWQE